MFNDYLEKVDKDFNSCGYLLKECLEGKAYDYISINTGYSNDPNPNEVINLLKDKYGDYNNILLQLEQEHATIGETPSFTTDDMENMDEIQENAEKHLVLLRKARYLLSESPNLLDNSRHIRRIASFVLPLEPYRIRYFGKEKNMSGAERLEYMIQNIIEIIEVVERNKMATRNTTHYTTNTNQEQYSYSTFATTTHPNNWTHNQNNINQEPLQQLQYQNQQSPTQHPYNSPSSNTQQSNGNSCKEVRDDTGNRCHICKTMAQYNVLADDNLHRFSEKGNPEPDSCPHLRGKTVKQRWELCNSHRICPGCLFNQLSSIHSLEACDYTRHPQFSTQKCKHNGCNIRYSVCFKHQHLNTDFLNNRHVDYKRSNLNYIPF